MEYLDINDRISYKYYDKKAPILVVYNYANNATYYYDSASADILYFLLINDFHNVEVLLKKYKIANEDFNLFLKEINSLFNSKKYQLDASVDKNCIDNVDYLKTIQSYIFEQGIMFRFHLDITGRCTHRCLHCYHTFDKYSDDRLSLDNIKILFNELDKLGVFIIVLSGGEPFLRNDLMQIIQEGERYGFIFQILTNGMLLTEDIIKCISLHNIAKLSFSYYGNDEQHEHITGDANFRRKLINNIDLCLKYKVRFELKFVLLESNVSSFDEYVNICKNYNITPLFEPCLIPKIDGNNSNFSERLHFDTYCEFMKNHIGYFYNEQDIEPWRNDIINCSAGKYGLYCNHEGKIYPCVSYRQYLGNYLDVVDIWKNSKILKNIINRTYSQFIHFNKHTFCKYCYQICPGLSLCENNNSLDCHNSGCMIAKVLESVHNKQ